MISLRLRHNTCAIFLEDFATLLQAGATLKEAIHLLQAAPDYFQRRVAAHLAESIRQGQSVATGLAPWLPPTITALLRAGEHANTLETALRTAATALSQRQHTAQQLVHQLTYPSLVFLLAISLLLVVSHTVLEPFARFKPMSVWPSAGLHLYAWANAVQVYGLLFATGLVMLMIASSLWLKTYTGTWRTQLDQWPVLSWYRRAVSAHVLQMLGLMLQQGITLKAALELLEVEASPYLQWHLSRMQQLLQQGQSLVADILNTQLLDAHIQFRLKLLSRSQQAAIAMQTLGTQITCHVQQSIRYAGKIIHATLLLMTAMLAAAILLGIYAVGSGLALP